ncbi:Initiation-specific alpha-1,6-mannosyltransferase [Lachnellula suecica]|uniref:Initiation-specific alpha-1,6-mannosyltransferase n=1 Tax=Lachnellula suecica TaxID=602035 RepID=A0A8T9BW89_9HELO|nr:Initiation-specific alpha-1,6-mannosyltransferase [Lachnellula suecica]
MMQTTASVFGTLLSKQIRRALPAYVLCVLLFLFFIKADHLAKIRHTPGDVLKHALAYQSNSRLRNTKIPRKIWQTWKVDPLSFEERDSSRARPWTQMNSGYRYEVLTDGNDLAYVETHFGPDGLNRLDIVNTYRSLTAMIIKADLLRYLVMYIEGGFYADIDVEALRPIDTWIPSHMNENDIDLIIGVEIDEPNFLNHTILGQKCQSFCQWTFACKPRVPVMLKLVDHILHWLNEISQRQNVPISDIELDFDDVLTGTGPSAFTKAVLKEMEAQARHRIPWDTFHALQEPTLVGNTLVLTVEAFAAGQGHSNSGNHDSPAALVKHHYHASKWPSRHPRYSHPAFGMVEECNWAPDCVEQWTKNTTAYPSLSEEHKEKLLAEKAVVDKERLDKETAEKEQKEREEAERKNTELRAACESESFTNTAPPKSSSTQTIDAPTPPEEFIPGTQPAEFLPGTQHTEMRSLE